MNGPSSGPPNYSAYAPVLLPTAGTQHGLGALTGKLTPLAQKGTTAKPSKGRFLPGRILQEQAEKIGTLAGTKPNPLADKANWQTGGRKTAFGAGSSTGDPMMWYYVGGAALLLLFVMKRRKK